MWYNTKIYSVFVRACTKLLTLEISLITESLVIHDKLFLITSVYAHELLGGGGRLDSLWMASHQNKPVITELELPAPLPFRKEGEELETEHYTNARIMKFRVSG